MPADLGEPINTEKARNHMDKRTRSNIGSGADRPRIKVDTAGNDVYRTKTSRYIRVQKNYWKVKGTVEHSWKMTEDHRDTPSTKGMDKVHSHRKKKRGIRDKRGNLG